MTKRTAISGYNPTVSCLIEDSTHEILGVCAINVGIHLLRKSNFSFYCLTFGTFTFFHLWTLTSLVIGVWLDVLTFPVFVSHRAANDNCLIMFARIHVSCIKSSSTTTSSFSTTTFSPRREASHTGPGSTNIHDLMKFLHLSGLLTRILKYFVQFLSILSWLIHN